MPSKNKSKGKSAQQDEAKEEEKVQELTQEGASKETTVEIESTQQEEKKEVVEFKEEAEEIEKSVQQDEAKENVEEESQAQIVKNVLEKLGLASDEIKPEDKIDTLCVIFKQTLTENVKMKDTLANMAGQLEKNDMTKAALQKLCEALKTQVNLKDEENTLKLQEETKKRIEIAKNFESTMGELTKLIETHSSHNSSLKEENLLMANKLEELLREYEQRENKIANISEEFHLKTQLFEAQLAKAKIEKAELGADFNKERLILQKQLLEAKKNVEIMMSREDNLKEQIELYAAQYEDLSKGVDDKKNNFGQFKSQMDKLNKRLRSLEADGQMWKDKFDESTQYVVKLNASKAEADLELETTKKKLAAMEKLNRTLTAERATLLKEKNSSQNGT